MAEMEKNLPAMQGTWVRSLGGKDPLEKGMLTHSGILAWRIPWTEKPGELQSKGAKKGSNTTGLDRLNHNTHEQILGKSMINQ